MRPDKRLPWERWLRSWFIITLWLGLTPVVITAIYYLVRNPRDFESGLKLLQPEKPIWALRIGSESCERPGLPIISKSFGVNADSPSFERARSKVWNQELYGTYQATYVGWFHGESLPEVFMVSRSLTRQGDVSYGTWRSGFKPIAMYLVFIFAIGAGGALFFDVIGGKKKPPVDTAA